MRIRRQFEAGNRDITRVYSIIVIKEITPNQMAKHLHNEVQVQQVDRPVLIKSRKWISIKRKLQIGRPLPKKKMT